MTFIKQVKEFKKKKVINITYYRTLYCLHIITVSLENSKFENKTVESLAYECLNHESVRFKPTRLWDKRTVSGKGVLRES